jgi:hypothetical protein
MRRMTRKYRLLFGPLAGIILGLGIGGLALLIPGYSHVHQTVSEIGEIGSPARLPFAVMLGCVAICILIFAPAVRDLSLATHHSRLAAYLIAFMALPAAGIAVFAYPHPAHNLFGMSELIGYQAPRLCSYMETGPTSEICYRALLGLLRTDMSRDRFKLERICRSGLGLREAGSRACTKSSLRCVVRLVRGVRHTIV